MLLLLMLMHVRNDIVWRKGRGLIVTATTTPTTAVAATFTTYTTAAAVRAATAIATGSMFLGSRVAVIVMTLSPSVAVIFMITATGSVHFSIVFIQTFSSSIRPFSRRHGDIVLSPITSVPT